MKRLAAIATAVFVGVLIRAFFLQNTEFPLGDGGLFYAMAQDIQKARFALPWFASYNGGDIPFAYPPLAIYLIAALATLGWELLDVLRILPAIVSTLTVLAFYPLARLLVTERAAAFATVVFAILPEGYLRTIMGGGITRSLGMLFAILALRYVYLTYIDGRPRYLAMAALCCASTVLSHPEAGWFTAYSILLILTFSGFSRRRIAHSALLVGATLLLSSPWWLTVATRHGLGTFWGAANGTGGLWGMGFLRLLRLSVTEIDASPLVAALALLGIVVSASQKRFHLIAWLATVFILDPRNPYMKALAPLSLLIGLGISDLLVPALEGSPKSRWRSLAPVVTLGLLLGILTFLSMHNSFQEIMPMSRQDRESMEWVAANTDPSSAFLLVTPPNVDRGVAEWFPALAQRRSLSVAQGREWIGSSAFLPPLRLQESLAQCSDRGTECLETASAGIEEPYTHIYISGPDAGWGWSLKRDLGANVEYRAIHATSNVTIYERLR